MRPPRLRLTVKGLLIGIMLAASSLGSYIAGRKDGYAEGTRRPPNYAKDRAIAFVRKGSVRSNLEQRAIYGVARQIEAENPGFLARKPRVRAVPWEGDPYSDRQWTVTFTDPASKNSFSLITQVDKSLDAEYDAEIVR